MCSETNVRSSIGVPIEVYSSMLRNSDSLLKYVTCSVGPCVAFGIKNYAGIFQKKKMYFSRMLRISILLFFFKLTPLDFQ